MKFRNTLFFCKYKYQESDYRKIRCSHQSGRSMIEMLGVLAIIGVLSIGGIAGYSKAMHKHKMNETKYWIAEAANNYYAFAINHNPKDLIAVAYDSTIIRMYIAPEEWKSNGNKAPIGVPMYFSASGSLSSQHFSVSLFNLTKADCADLVYYGASNYPLSSLWVNPLNKSMDGPLCKDESGKNLCTTAISSLNTPAKAAKACSGEKNSILLMFKDQNY